jgi:hypothetical protein
MGCCRFEGVSWLLLKTVTNLMHLEFSSNTWYGILTHYMASIVGVINGGDAQNPWDITHVVFLFNMAIFLI